MPRTHCAGEKKSLLLRLCTGEKPTKSPKVLSTVKVTAYCYFTSESVLVLLSDQYKTRNPVTLVFYIYLDCQK